MINYQPGALKYCLVLNANINRYTNQYNMKKLSFVILLLIVGYIVSAQKVSI